MAILARRAPGHSVAHTTRPRDLGSLIGQGRNRAGGRSPHRSCRPKTRGERPFSEVRCGFALAIVRERPTCPGHPTPLPNSWSTPKGCETPKCDQNAIGAGSAPDKPVVAMERRRAAMTSSCSSSRSSGIAEARAYLRPSATRWDIEAALAQCGKGSAREHSDSSRSHRSRPRREHSRRHPAPRPERGSGTDAAPRQRRRRWSAI